MDNEPQYPSSIYGIVAVENRADNPKYRFVTSLGDLDKPQGILIFKDSLPFLNEVARNYRQKLQDEKQITLPCLIFYTTRRLAHPPDLADAPPVDLLDELHLARTRGYEGCLDPAINLRTLRTWMDREARIEFEEREETPQSRAVREAMRRALEGVDEVRWSSRDLDTRFTFSDGSRVLYRELSDGQKNLVALVQDIALRMVRLNPHLGDNALSETPGLILIDEIDMHLHPAWQRRILRDLCSIFPKVQFVTTTHSPVIISEVQPESLFFLTKEGNVTQIQPALQSYGLDANWILERWMDAESRPAAIATQLSQLKETIANADWETAHGEIDQLRSELHGDTPELVRLEAGLYALEAQENAVD